VLDHFLKKHQASFTVKNIPVIWLLYAIILFTFIDLFTQLPVMSTYAASLGASAAVAGFAVGLYSLTNMFGNIFSGIFTDRSGASIVLKIGLAAVCCILLLYSVVDEVAELLFIRFLHGFLSGLIAPAAFAYLANQTKREKQGSQSAITGSFVGIAAIAGPAYSGIMASRTSVPFVFATVAAMGLLLFIASILYLQSNGARKVKEQKERTKLVLNTGIVQAYCGAFFLMFSQGALSYLLPLHVESLGYSSRLSGMLLSMFGLVAVALFLLPTNRLFDRVKPVIVFSTGISVIGLSQILIGQSSEIISLFIVMALYGVGFALLFPAMNTLLVHSTTQQNRGKAYGVFYAFFSLGTVAGSSGIGLLPASLEVQFIVTGCVLFCCAIGVLAASMRAEMQKNETSG
jgi:MFS family permease